LLRKAQAPVQLRTNWRTFDEIKETRRRMSRCWLIVGRRSKFARSWALKL